MYWLRATTTSFIPRASECYIEMYHTQRFRWCASVKVLISLSLRALVQSYRPTSGALIELIETCCRFTRVCHVLNGQDYEVLESRAGTLSFYRHLAKLVLVRVDAFYIYAWYKNIVEAILLPALCFFRKPMRSFVTSHCNSPCDKPCLDCNRFLNNFSTLFMHSDVARTSAPPCNFADIECLASIPGHVLFWETASTHANTYVSRQFNVLQC